MYTDLSESVTVPLLVKRYTAADCEISPYMKMLFPVSGDMPYAELDRKLLLEKDQ